MPFLLARGERGGVENEGQESRRFKKLAEVRGRLRKTARAAFENKSDLTGARKGMLMGFHRGIRPLRLGFPHPLASTLRARKQMQKWLGAPCAVDVWGESCVCNPIVLGVRPHGFNGHAL